MNNINEFALAHFLKNHAAIIQNKFNNDSDAIASCTPQQDENSKLLINYNSRNNQIHKFVAKEKREEVFFPNEISFRKLDNTKLLR